jgi:NAD(P)-dependent dehydrogenase (short-subunit alcohol dehydrogenase family)
MELSGKAVLITGASRGLGRALALGMAQKGACLALAARDAPALEKTAALCRTVPGVQAVAFPADLTEPETCRRVVEEAAAALGGLDLLVANAGLSMWAPFEQVHDLRLYDQLVRVNYLGVVYTLHAALPHLRARRGRIVAISSLQAWTGLPYHTGYAASKAALQGFLDSLEMETQGEISLLGVYPGWIRGTGLRAAALGADGQVLGESKRSHNRLSVTAEACSAAVVRAIERDRQTLFVPGILRALYLLRPVAWPLVRRILMQATHTQKRAG